MRVSPLARAVANIIEPGSKALIVDDGFFSNIFVQLVRIYGGTPVLIKEDYGKAVKPEMVADVADNNRDAESIFAVHSETSTGVKHDIESIGKISKQHDLIYVVDAVSSLGGMDLKADDWSVDICIGYASKAIGGINGIVPIAISNRIWEHIMKTKSNMGSRFLDLRLHRKCIDGWTSWGHPFPTSMPTSSIMALKKAIELALEEGLQERFKRHKICKIATRKAIESLGIEPLVRNDDDASETNSSLKLPNNLDADPVISIIKEKFNILVGTLNLVGLNGLRIAHMGKAASPHFLLPMFFGLEYVLNKMKWKTTGESVAMMTDTFLKLLES